MYALDIHLIKRERPTVEYADIDFSPKGPVTTGAEAPDRFWVGVANGSSVGPKILCETLKVMLNTNVRRN